MLLFLNGRKRRFKKLDPIVALRRWQLNNPSLIDGGIVILGASTDIERQHQKARSELHLSYPQSG